MPDAENDGGRDGAQTVKASTSWSKTKKQGRWHERAPGDLTKLSVVAAGSDSVRRSVELPLPVMASMAPPRAKKSRRREREEKLEEHETVMDLIHNVRHGGEVATRSQSRARNGTAGGNGTKSARIKGGALRVRWARFKQRLGTGSAFSESLLDGTGESTDSSRSQHRLTIGYGTAAEDDLDDGAEVDEVVVDNELGTSVNSVPSEHDLEPPRRSHSLNGKDESNKTRTTSFGTGDTQHTDGSWDSNFIFVFFRWRLFPMVYHFFALHFVEEKTEND